jgi:hypothetical protein
VKSPGKNERTFIEGERKIEGSQVLSARPFDKGRMKAKIL